MASSFSLGLYDGGQYRKDPTFKGAKLAADVAVIAVSSALPVGSLAAGTRSVFYAGRGALDIAEAEKGTGLLLKDTVGGTLLNKLEKASLKVLGKRLPYQVWQAASWIFAKNAKGEVVAFIRNPRADAIWLKIEKPILDAAGIAIKYK